MSAYDDLTFAPVLITDVFDTVNASSAWFDKNKLRKGPGSYPYVSRSGFSNGFETAVGWQGFEPNAGNAVTIGVDTQTVFYQPAPFYTSVKIQVLRHELLNEASGLILVSLLRSQMRKFAWGNGASLVRLAATRIVVPVITDDSGEQAVDWEGMTRLGEELMAHALTRTRGARTSDPSDADAEFPDLTFEPMLITDVFETMKASSAWYDKVHLKGGEPTIPYLSQTHSANSIAAIVADQGVTPEAGNCITVTLKTQATFYQPVPFYTAQNFLIFRHELLNAHSGLLLTAIMRRAMQKFSWGYGVSMARLAKTRIMVPVRVNDSGEQVADWDGMTAYGRIMRARAERAMSAAVA